jgi:hypothetical protein
MIVTQSSKEFESPDTGRFNATLCDVVDLGKQKNAFGEEKVRLRVVWVLDKNDSTGTPFRVQWQVNATVADKPKKSNLYEIAESVLGTAPPVPFDTETLIGRSNELIIVKAPDPKTGKVWANVKAILPLPAGAVPPPIPQGFVRAKDKPQRTQVSNGAPAVATAVTANTTASTPTAQPTVQGTAAAPFNAPTNATPAQQAVPQVDAAF